MDDFSVMLWVVSVVLPDTVRSPFTCLAIVCVQLRTSDGSKIIEPGRFSRSADFDNLEEQITGFTLRFTGVLRDFYVGSAKLFWHADVAGFIATKKGCVATALKVFITRTAGAIRLPSSA